MMVIVAGTNRRNSQALKFAQYCEARLKEKGIDTHLLALEDLPTDIFHPDYYDAPDTSSKLIQLQDDVIIPSNKFLFVVPEYNGGMPGALKLFIDALSVRKIDENFKGKKSCLIGIASGRAGNLRGMEHLTSILNFMGSIVMPNRLPISQIYKLKKDGTLVDKGTIEVIEQQLEDFIRF